MSSRELTLDGTTYTLAQVKDVTALDAFLDPTEDHHEVSWYEVDLGDASETVSLEDLDKETAKLLLEMALPM